MKKWGPSESWPWIFVSIDIRCNGDDATKISSLALKTWIIQMEFSLSCDLCTSRSCYAISMMLHSQSEDPHLQFAKFLSTNFKLLYATPMRFPKISANQICMSPDLFIAKMDIERLGGTAFPKTTDMSGVGTSVYPLNHPWFEESDHSTRFRSWVSVLILTGTCLHHLDVMHVQETVCMRQ